MSHGPRALRELSGPFAALDHRFTVSTDDGGLHDWLQGVLAPLAAGQGTASGRYVLRSGEPARLWFDDELLAEGTSGFALGMLLWHCNREAVARSPGLVRLHAAAACRGDAAVLLPAVMEAGKTTLVAGLVRAGLDYLSDEVAAIDPKTLRVRAYPKALSIDPGSWDVLADLEPHLPAAVRGLLPHQWIVPVATIRSTAEASAATPRLLIAPQYEAGARSRLEPLGRVDALVHVATTTFDLCGQPARDLEVIKRLVERCPTYRLVVGDLDQACTLVLDALDDLPHRAQP